MRNAIAIAGLCALLGARAAAGACVGDCDDDGSVRINELIAGVRIALGDEPVTVCPNAACEDGPAAIFVNCSVTAVRNALLGCAPCTLARPGPTCPAGESPVCTDPCGMDCACATDTPAPTPTATAEPPPTPALALSLDVSASPGEPGAVIAATLRHLGGVTASYLAGCSARCGPAFYRAVAFEVRGPDGAEVLVEDPCGGPLYCPTYLATLAPGASLTQTLTIAGTAWSLGPPDDLGYCGNCTQIPLADGHYVVTARFAYRLGTSWSDPPAPDLTATAEFDWPPQ